MRPQSTANVSIHKGAATLTPRHAALLALLLAFALLVVGQLYVTIPLVGDVTARFDVMPASAVFTGSAFGFAHAAGFLIFGPLSYRYGRKPIILIGLAATALATALVGLVPSFGILIAARAAQGIAASTFPPVALSLATEELPPQHRSLGVSLMSFAFLGAAPVAQFFAANAAGLPTIMLESAPLYLIGAAGLLFAARTDSAPVAAQTRQEGSGFIVLHNDPVVLTAWAAAIKVLFGFVSFQAGAQSLGSSLGVDLQILRVLGLPPLLLTFAAAPLTRRYGPSVTARAGLTLAALALVIAIAIAPTTMMIASVFLSGGVALAVPGLIAIVVARATNANCGLALAVYSLCLFLGASFTPPFVQTFSSFGTVPLWLLPALLLVVAALGITAAVRHPLVPHPN